MKNRIVQLTAVFVLASMQVAAVVAKEVNLYSGRKEALIKPALDDFTKQTGIKVNLVTGKADALLKRIEAEGAASPADILITTDVGRLHRAKQAGVLQAFESAALQGAVAENLRDKDSYWYGLSLRARPIFYAKDSVKPEQLSSYEDLASEKWLGRVCIRSSGNIYNQSLVASMVVAEGEASTQKWLNQFVKNFARSPAGGDTDQLRAVAAGECDIAIANTYYYGRLINSKKEEDRAVASGIGVFWPNQGVNGRGTHVNVSGAAITKSAKNKAEAIQLIEFLASPKTQSWYAQVNNEYPVVESVPASATLTSWGDFKRDSVALSQLGANNRKAVELMDKASWR